MPMLSDITPLFSRDHRRMYCRAGMTLLELVIVVFILGLVAVSAVSLTGGIDQQFRYDQTRDRLTMLSHAIVGNSTLTTNNQRSLSGYVADVGQLPPSIDALINGEQSFEQRPPIFDPTPEQDATSDKYFNDASGDEITLDEPRERLGKGWRGPYVQTEPSVSDERFFRDGWGNIDPVETEDELNNGWQFNRAEGRLTITSLGSDGTDSAQQPSEPDQYEADLSVTVEPSDWQLPLSGWSVTVTNRSTQPATDVRVALLIYEAGRWRRATTAGTPVNIESDGSQRLTFDEQQPAPIGEHLLVLIAGGNDTIGNGETPYENAAGERVTQRVRFLPRTSLPEVELVID
jgi:prepilin-type N-terminal cleavage/methylation domain-containing protein